MLCAKCVVCLLFICYSVVNSRTIYLELKSPSPEELTFLKRFGYLPELAGDDTDAAYSLNSISDALKKMQAFAGLPETGTLDDDTKKLFKTKRCGVRDIESVHSRNRRYILRQAWNKKSISYRVVNVSSTLEKSQVEEMMETGLAVWAPHGGLSFHKQDEGRADIQVSFVTGDHGDGFPFDGPGRIVAHAFPPPLGAMHFDDDELWGDDEDEEDDVTDFFAVAVHEIGHALGLAHSSVKTSVMYPYYRVPVEKLDADDILGMQELYLKDDVDESTENPLSRSSLVPHYTKADSDEQDENYMPDLCMTNYDTLQVIHGKIYVFEEEWVWVLRDRKEMEDGYPQKFQDVFVGISPHVTTIKTIYENRKGNVVIFSARDYWEFDRSFRLIKEGTISDFLLPEEVLELTTVFRSNFNNKTYLIEEESYWRLDEDSWTMDPGFPKEMSMWRQVPYPVDAAIIWKGDTFFFQGPRFWRFDNVLVKAHDYYPVPTALVWFNCPSTPEMGRYSSNDGP